MEVAQHVRSVLSLLAPSQLPRGSPVKGAAPATCTGEHPRRRAGLRRPGNRGHPAGAARPGRFPELRAPRPAAPPRRGSTAWFATSRGGAGGRHGNGDPTHVQCVPSPIASGLAVRQGACRRSSRRSSCSQGKTAKGIRTSFTRPAGAPAAGARVLLRWSLQGGPRRDAGRGPDGRRKDSRKYRPAGPLRKQTRPWEGEGTLAAQSYVGRFPEEWLHLSDTGVLYSGLCHNRDIFKFK